jgi:lysozyme family protein
MSDTIPDILPPSSYSPETAVAIQEALSRTLANEGGWSDASDDPGGATMHGVTLAVFQTIEPGATIEDLKNLTAEQAQMIYLNDYIQPASIDALPPAIIPQISDCAVNMDPLSDRGRAEAALILQRAINDANGNTVPPLNVDGTIGPKTIAAAQAVCASSADMLNNFIVVERLAVYRKIIANKPASAKFMPEWTKRANGYRAPWPPDDVQVVPNV